MSLTFIPLIVFFLLVIVAIAMYVRILIWLLAMLIPDMANTFMSNGFYRLAFSLTEPLISPFRRIVPMTGSVDWFSFIFANISIYIMINFMSELAGGAHFLFF